MCLLLLCLRKRSSVVWAFAYFGLVISAAAQPHKAVPRRSSIAARFDEVRSSPPELYAFLLRMPKGADLHNHLAGAIYAESYLQDAVKDSLCIDRRALALVSPAVTSGGHCESGQIEASHAQADELISDSFIDSLSMRAFVPGAESAHDHFFRTFEKFQAVSRSNEPSSLAEVIRRAGEQNESYLELMAFTAGTSTLGLGKQLSSVSNFDSARGSLFSAGLQKNVEDLRQRVRLLHDESRKALNCANEPASASCAVKVRYIAQVLRNVPPEQVFAQALACFMLAATEPLVVSVNFVQPEDGFYSMRDYHLHMQMVGYLKQLYPTVRITLHAGELASGLVPPEGLRFHIREALEIAHAERIGHGVDIMYETGAVQLLRNMHDRSVAVEINLTSNDLILGIKDQNHPFPVYLKYGVPVTLATDDEGVSRSHLTEEYKRAVLQYHLSYTDLKQIVRNGLQYSFLPGASYWQNSSYAQVAPPCRQSRTAGSCVEFLHGSEKASLQFDLEERFRTFESQEQTP